MPPSLPPPDLAAKLPARAADGANAPGHRRRRQRKSPGNGVPHTSCDSREYDFSNDIWAAL